MKIPPWKYEKKGKNKPIYYYMKININTKKKNKKYY